MAETTTETVDGIADDAVQQTPAKAASLHAKVLDQLRDYIIEGNIEEDARIPERKLCELFQISRTPLREALKVLASEGLVELLPNRGARLRALQDADIIASFEVIGGLEALAGQLACERMTEAEYEEIERLHHQMYKHYVRTELQDYFKYNRAIHNAIMQCARNPVLLETYASLSTSMRRNRYTANLNVARDRWGEAMREHEAMLSALHRRDGLELSDIMFKHLRATCASAMEWLAEERKAKAAAAKSAN